MDDNIKVGELTKIVESTSTLFEKTNTDLKRKYLLWTISAFNSAAKKVSVGKGTFGTGYPFYVLDTNFEGDIPVIQEQIRYNRELIRDGIQVASSIWECKRCMEQKRSTMPDLKSICNPCPKVIKGIKPRKIINRLPDIDMWLICEDETLERAQEELSQQLDRIGMKPSDVNPIKSIEDVDEIAKLLGMGIMPTTFLPVDAHIIEYSRIKELIENVPVELNNTKQNSITPYLPIYPISYRKKWQYDDEAYNYIYDFLSAFTEFDFPFELQGSLKASRRQVATEHTEMELLDFLKFSATEANFRRFQEEALERIFINKVREWKKAIRDEYDNERE